MGSNMGSEVEDILKLPLGQFYFLFLGAFYFCG